MCGIIGSTNIELKSGFASALKYLEKRGPDSVGEWSNDFIHLGHTRLAIRDISNGGAQPMLTLDGRYVLVFNGEIYNDSEIRRLLETHNVTFTGTSDTELICHLFSIYGSRSIPMLEGMFAIAIFDTLERKLYLTRDPFGIKPLYIYLDEKSIYFSSEVTALYIMLGRKLSPSEDSLRQYEHFGHVASSETLFSDVFECGPGELYEYDLNKLTYTKSFITNIRKYWQSDISIKSDANYESDIEKAIINSFKRHLVSDVPVCLFLSSGLDSAVLASVACKLGIKLDCITIGFIRYRDTALDEVPLAKELANHFGHKHHIIYYSDSELEDLLSEFVRSMDQPSIDGFNTWLASKFARSIGFRVAVSGAGADELFNGYSHYNFLRKIYSMNFLFKYLPLKFSSRFLVDYLPYRIKKTLLLVAHSDSLSDMLDIYRSANMRFPNSSSPKNRDFLIWGRPFSSDADLARFCSYYEATNYLRFRLLRDSDWASMAHGLELRLPFIDIHFLKDISPYLLFSSLVRKVALFSKFPKLGLPAWLFNRKKSGFNIPFVGFGDSVVVNSYESRMNYLMRIKHLYLSSLLHRK